MLIVSTIFSCQNRAFSMPNQLTKNQIYNRSPSRLSTVNLKLNLKRRIRRNIAMSEELWLDMEKKISIISLKRNKILVNQGELSKSIFFIVSGGIVSSYINEQGVKRAVWFFLDNDFDFVGCNDSLFKNVRTKYELKAIEDSVVIKINFNNLLNWQKSFVEFKGFYNDVLINKFFFLQEVRNEFLTSKTLDFFKYLLENHPVFFKRIPDYYLSQFLGISPEWYCKLKKKLFAS